VSDYSRIEAAERAGIGVDDLTALVELGIVRPAAGDRFSAGDVRRAELVQSIKGTGISLEGLAAALERGTVSLDFLDAPVYERFSALGELSFQQVSDRTGVPINLLLLIREAAGSAPPSPDDRMRDEEVVIADFIEAQVKAGFRPIAIERLIRVAGDSLRRIAESEADWWRSEVMEPAMAAGMNPEEVSATEMSISMSALAERAILAMYHSQEMRAWTGNIIGSLETMLAAAGLHSRLERPPAMCFLDITGYTRLTQERGDEAAASLAGTLSRVVQRASVSHGGRAVKWLGDGVMFYFPDPGPGVVAALDMVDGVADAGLPPAHVGLHAGPIIFQEGDYYGQTVNIASRIAEYARPGEVLVSQAVVDTAGSEGLGATFTQIGPVELKGVDGAMGLYAARRG
jgi:class 3 adenylate cyclase/DNA-binding transcriptional MerR regulator